jgi:uncharacterized Zn finger protein
MRFFPPSRPRPAQGGIKAHSRRGEFGESWWARRWISVLEGFQVGARLHRGREYARRGQVLSISVKKGLVEARVQGSRRTPYQVEIAVPTLSASEWKGVVATLAREARFAAQLLALQLPADIEEAFRGTGVSLFPARRADLDTHCSCPDAISPCKHIAAVYYLLGEEFDRDPFLILRLRGLDREELLRLLGREPARGASAELAGVSAPPVPLDPDAARFWQGSEVTEEMLGEAEPPEVNGALVRRLGRFPFWGGSEPLLETLDPIYEAASARGLRVFLGEAREGPTPS